MTDRIYCDACGKFAYIFSDSDTVEIISACACPKFLMFGENE